MPGGAVSSWLTPASSSGGEPSRTSSAASAGGGQAPLPMSPAITGYSTETPAGAIVTATAGARSSEGPNRSFAAGAACGAL